MSARKAGGDPALRLELARAYSRLGQLRGDYYHNMSLGDYRGAIQLYDAGRALLEATDDWPSALRHERAEVLSELYGFTAEERGVLGEVDAGLRAIETARRWQDTADEAYAARHTGARSPTAWLRGQRYLSEADLLVMAGDLTAAMRSLEAMRRDVETLYAPERALLGRGTCHSRLGSAQHILAVSMRAGLADPVAERAVLQTALASQERGHRFRQQAWEAQPDWQTLRGLVGQCRLFMGNLVFALGRPADGERWIREGIELGKSAEVPEGGSWGYQWRARRRILDRAPRVALEDLALARKPLAAAAGSQPAGTLAPNALATIDEDIGDAHWLVGDRAAAERAYGAALALRERLVSSSPTNGEFAASVVYSVTRVASRLIESGRPAEARVHTQRVRALLEQQAGAPGAVGSRSTELAWLLLVAQPADLRDPAAALRHARRAVDLPRGQHPDALAVLAVAQFVTGGEDAAVATALRAYELVPEMRAGRSEATLRRDIRENLRRHPFRPLPRPVWF